MNSHSALVPSALLNRIGGASGEGPAGTHFPGVALFADISGYTGTAEQLCAQGTQGVEALSRLLDDAFGWYTTCVDSHGGEIACFAGDALLAWWPLREWETSATLSRVLECSRELHTPVQVSLPDRTLEPRIHVGIAAGPLWAARLGGGTQWKVLLSGTAVRDASRAAGTAAPGSTIVSPATRALLENLDTSGGNTARTGRIPDAHSTGIRTGPSHNTTPLAGGDTLVPRAVREWTDHGLSGWIARIRDICALQVRIGGLDDSAPDAVERHQATVCAIHGALRRWSGSSGVLIHDDKGLVFKLCLGMPHDSHADDAVRAVRAGLEISQALEGLHLPVSAGVASGQGICLLVGGPERSQYVAIGRFMHLAARLMEKAGRGLMCTREVAARAEQEVSLGEETRVALKGIGDPVSSFRVGPPRPEGARGTHVFGRSAEKSALTRLLDPAGNEGGRILLIRGKAGMGKTTLVHYLRREAAAKDLDCRLGGARSVENTVAFQAWQPVFEQLLFRHDASARPAPIPAESHPVLRELGEIELAPLINAVVPGFMQESELSRRLSPRARAGATRGVLSEALGLLAGDRFLLVLEDSHWMDSASWGLLERVVRDHPRSRIVLTARPFQETDELAALRARERFEEIELAPLDEQTIHKLVESVLRNRVATEVFKEVALRAEGHPLFAREYALLLKATRGITIVNGTLRLTRGPDGSGAVRIPATIRGMITSLIDTLSPEEDLLLKSASVLGVEFPRQELDHVYPVATDHRAMSERIATLEKLQLLRRERNDGPFAFHHAMIREVTYKQLTSRQRIDLHRRAAETLESIYSEDLSSRYAILAHHWSSADVPGSTVRYADLAASQAIGFGAYAEAESLIRNCLDLSENRKRVSANAKQRVRWHKQLAEVAYGLGRVEERGIEARRALAIAGRHRPHSHVSLLARAAEDAVTTITRHAFRRRPGNAVDGETRLVHASAWRHSAASCWYSGDPVGMLCDSMSAVASAERAPPSPILAGACAELGGIVGVVGLRALGESLLRRAIRIGDLAGDPGGQASAHIVRCLYAVGVCDWLTARESALLAQRYSTLIDDRVNWANAQAIHFWARFYQAHMDRARALANALYERACDTGNLQHRVWGLRFLAVCDLREGQPAPARERLDEALGLLGETAAANERISIIGPLALACVRTGHADRGNALLKDGLIVMAAMKRPVGHATLEGYSSLTEVSLHAWREHPGHAALRDQVRFALRGLRRYQSVFPVGDPRYRLWRGHWHAMRGEDHRAHTYFRWGKTVAERRGMAWEAGRCEQALSPDRRQDRRQA